MALVTHRACETRSPSQGCCAPRSRQHNRKGRSAFEETRGLVAAFLAIQETEVFRGFEMPAPECRIVAAADVAEELSEATVAAVQFAANPTPMNRERALEETMEARCVVDRYARQLTRGQWLTPMSA
jgi:hypothetical protein